MFCTSSEFRHGCRSDEVKKKKWLDLKSETTENVAKHRRVMQATGGGQACSEFSELGQCIRAITGETALSGVPSTEHLDTDLDPLSCPIPFPVLESQGKLVLQNNFNLTLCLTYQVHKT